LTFTEEWFSDAACDVLGALAAKVRMLRGRIVEIGSWEGKSTCALANASFPGVVHAIDTWAGSPGESSEQLAAERDVYETFTRNVAELTQGNVRPHRTNWRDYFRHAAFPCRLVFIDAEHTYREVFDTITKVRPLMVPGGVICGDDWHHPPIRQAVADTLGPVNSNGPVWWQEV
jgi:predicted O-methyltransferase YrrM